MRVDRPKQETPEAMVARLMGLIRGQFCGDLADKDWFKHSHFVKRNVVLWPARFVKGKEFTLPVARYEAIMRGIFDGIKEHGQTGQIRYWPGYLMKCVQDHWRLHWEEYYNEAKAVRNISETALVSLGKVAPADRGLEALAVAQSVLAGRRRKQPAKRAGQLNLFGT